MARPARFERATAWFVARYSIQLSYGRLMEARDYPLLAAKTQGWRRGFGKNQTAKSPGCGVIQVAVLAVLSSKEVSYPGDEFAADCPGGDSLKSASLTLRLPDKQEDTGNFSLFRGKSARLMLPLLHPSAELRIR